MFLYRLRRGSAQQCRYFPVQSTLHPVLPSRMCQNWQWSCSPTWKWVQWPFHLKSEHTLPALLTLKQKDFDIIDRNRTENSKGFSNVTVFQPLESFGLELIFPGKKNKKQPPWNSPFLIPWILADNIFNTTVHYDGEGEGVQLGALGGKSACLHGFLTWWALPSGPQWHFDLQDAARPSGHRDCTVG